MPTGRYQLDTDPLLSASSLISDRSSFGQVSVRVRLRFAVLVKFNLFLGRVSGELRDLKLS